VLEQESEWFDELELEVFGQSANVVVALDVRRATAAAGFDDVRVKGALNEEFNLLACGGLIAKDLGDSAFKGPDELAADDLALGFRVGDAVEEAEERLLRVDGHQACTG